MAPCKLEIVLHSGKSLTNVKHIGRMDPYVVVWISGRRKQTKQLQTKVAKKGGCFPVWNYSMEFNISSKSKSYTLFCVIKHDGHISDRDIGQVQVPFEDLLAGGASGDNVSYPVIISTGEVKGELILSHKFSHLEIDDKDGSCKLDDLPKISGGSQKDTMMKRIGKKVGTQVASKVVLLAGTAGILAFMPRSNDESSVSAPAADAEVKVEDQAPASAPAPAPAEAPAATDAEVKVEDQAPAPTQAQDEDKEEEDDDEDDDDYEDEDEDEDDDDDDYDDDF